jgi:density-regulated protein
LAPIFFLLTFLFSSLTPSLYHFLTACSLPPEYCEYGPKEKYTTGCLPFIEKNFPHLLKATSTVPSSAPSSSTGSGAPTTTTTNDGSSKVSSSSNDISALSSSVAALSVGGGDASKKATKKIAEPKAPIVTIEVKERGRRTVTTVCGLDAYGIKLKEAASALGKKFGAGASVGKSATGVQEIDVQGDVAFDLPELINKLYPEVKEDCIRVKGD